MKLNIHKTTPPRSNRLTLRVSKFTSHSILLKTYRAPAFKTVSLIPTLNYLISLYELIPDLN